MCGFNFLKHCAGVRNKVLQHEDGHLEDDPGMEQQTLSVLAFATPILIGQIVICAGRERMAGCRPAEPCDRLILHLAAAPFCPFPSRLQVPVQFHPVPVFVHFHLVPVAGCFPFWFPFPFLMLFVSHHGWILPFFHLWPVLVASCGLVTIRAERMQKVGCPGRHVVM